MITEYGLVNDIVVMVILVVGIYLAYMSSHMVSESKLGRKIPLPWEKKKDSGETSHVKRK